MTGRPEQAVLAVVRLIGDQEVEVSAQQSGRSTLSGAVTVLPLAVPAPPGTLPRVVVNSAPGLEIRFAFSAAVAWPVPALQ